MEDGPAPPLGASNSAPEPTQAVSTSVGDVVAVKDKEKGKEKERDAPKVRERESRAVVTIVQEKKKESLQERTAAQKRRGGLPFRFQLLNTPIRPFG